MEMVAHSSLGASPSLQSEEYSDHFLFSFRRFSRLPRFLALPVFDRSLPSYDHCLSICISIDVTSRRVHSPYSCTVHVPSDSDRHGTVRIHIYCSEAFSLFTSGRLFRRSSDHCVSLGHEVLCSVLYSCSSGKLFSS